MIYFILVNTWVRFLWGKNDRGNFLYVRLVGTPRVGDKTREYETFIDKLRLNGAVSRDRGAEGTPCLCFFQ